LEDDNIRVYQPLDMETAPSIYGCILVTVQLHLMMLETPHHHHVCQPHGYSKKSFALVCKYIGEGGPTLVLIVTNSTFPGSTQQSAFLLTDGRLYKHVHLMRPSHHKYGLINNEVISSMMYGQGIGWS
jgi:hypothetical protein